MEENIHRTPIWDSPNHDEHVNILLNSAGIASYHAIFLRSCSRYVPAKFPPKLLIQNSIDYLLYRVRPDVDTPLEPSDSIVHDARTQVTHRFESVSSLCTWGRSARAPPLRDRIRSMVHVCHRREGVVSGCGNFWRDGYTKTG